jgi:APA family basic amino acid/polyamine antiporter
LHARIDFVALALVVFFIATGGALFVLRRKAATRERPYRAWGYPVAPALYILANLAIFAAVVLSQFKSSLLCLGVILTGLPAFLFWSAKNRADQVRRGPH